MNLTSRHRNVLVSVEAQFSTKQQVIRKLSFENSSMEDYAISLEIEAFKADLEKVDPTGTTNDNLTFTFSI